MLARTRTLAVNGIDAVAVDVEVDIHRGLPAFSLVGLPDAAVRESRERVRAAIVNSGFEFPLKRITTNLAPADLRKAGPGFDLAIAVAILLASGQIPTSAVEDWFLVGELALDGRIRPLNGVLAMAEEAARLGAAGIGVPTANAGEAAIVGAVPAIPLERLGQLPDLASGVIDVASAADVVGDGRVAGPGGLSHPDLADLRGQGGLRRGLEVAAAGGHGLLVIGPPGAGKSLAARRLPSILPPLVREHAIEVTRIASVAGRAPGDGALCGRPFRAPHHTISPAGLVGGGSPPRPGEITLAHRGVLFLDELGEFSRSSLEALRQPLEDGTVAISRARGGSRFPARFQLIAAANPCPCGHGEDSQRCQCPAERIRAYENRLSGALADRFDMAMSVEQPSADALASGPGESSAVVAGRVCEARERQEARLGPGRCNATMTEPELEIHAELDGDAAAAMAEGHHRFGLSGRGWSRVLKVARTCADLEGLERIGAVQVNEALTLRRRSK